jgi:hypothetical protein
LGITIIRILYGRDISVNLAKCPSCSKLIPDNVIIKGLQEKRDLRCSCGKIRTWKSLIPLSPITLDDDKSLELDDGVPCAAPQPLSRPDDLSTIVDAKNYIESRVMEGVDCPCCGRNNKRYTRPLDAGIVRGLVALVRSSPNGEIVHVKEIPEMLVDGVAWTSHDFAKARYWGLCDEVSKDELTEDIMVRATRKRRKGFWRSTDKGRRFVYSMVKVPKYVDLLNNNFEKLHGVDWSIQDALGHPFDYHKVTGVAQSGE